MTTTTAVRTDDIGFGNLKLLQDPTEFCYGVDAVILADFAASICGGYESAADLGTGSGVIPFILHHKAAAYSSRSFGVDFNARSIELARKSSRINGLDECIHFGTGDVEQLSRYSSMTDLLDFADDPIWSDVISGGGFDVVTCNPPYFAKGRAIPSKASAKFRARHETTADIDDFICASAKILKRNGQLFLVHRPSRLVDIFESCRRYKLEPKTIRFVVPQVGQAPNIVLIHCVMNGGKELKYIQELAVYNEQGVYSEEIQRIYERSNP